MHNSLIKLRTSLRQTSGSCNRVCVVCFRFEGRKLQLNGILTAISITSAVQVGLFDAMKFVFSYSLLNVVLTAPWTSLQRFPVFWLLSNILIQIEPQFQVLLRPHSSDQCTQLFQKTLTSAKDGNQARKESWEPCIYVGYHLLISTPSKRSAESMKQNTAEPW